MFHEKKNVKYKAVLWYNTVLIQNKTVIFNITKQ